jgi:hypothetical protein
MVGRTTLISAVAFVVRSGNPSSVNSELETLQEQGIGLDLAGVTVCNTWVRWVL